MRRGVAVAGTLALCLPLLFAASVVSGSTGAPAPFVLALAAAVLLAAGAWAGCWWYTPVPALALFLILLGAVFDSTVVKDDDDLRAARFGLPFDFVEAELSVSPPFPYRVGWNPWENPAQLLVPQLVASYALVLGGVSLVVFAIHSLTSRGLRSRTTGNDASSGG